MFKNYFKIAWRNIRKHNITSFVNIAGLALGLACCILLFLFVRHEWTYDNFHKKGDRIYRIVSVNKKPNGSTQKSAFTPAPLSDALESTYPQIQEAVRLRQTTLKIKYKQQSIKQNVLFADSSFSAVFSFNFLKGNPTEALSKPDNVILTKKTAQKLFDSKDAIGKRITIDFDGISRDYLVAGIIKEAPLNSSIQFDIILPFSNYLYPFSKAMRRFMKESWEISLATTFVLLPKNEKASTLESQLPGFVAQHFSDKSVAGLNLQPLANIHMNTSVSGGLTAPANPIYSYILAAIALLVLLMACINFVTLSLGRSENRTREVGVRKVAGADRRQIAFQFWGEAILTSGIALVIGVIIAKLFLPTFNNLAQLNLPFNLLTTAGGWLALLALILIVGIIAGGYPALVLSGFQPANIFRNKTDQSQKSGFTQTLIVTQFTIAIAFLIGVFIMSEQLQYISKMELGFNEEHVILIEPNGDSEQNAKIYEPFKQEITSYSGIKGVTSSFSDNGVGTTFTVPIKTRNTGEITAYVSGVDNGFLRVLDINLLAGQPLSTINNPKSAGQKEIVVNKAFVEAMGWSSSEAAIGKKLSAAKGSPFSQVFRDMTIIGVVESYHFQSLRKKIGPLILARKDALGGGVISIMVRITPGHISRALSTLKKTWNKVSNDALTSFKLLDDVIAQQYQSEQRWRSIVSYATIFALIIACFGLFGLATLAAKRRTKEIGIRKVMGASVTDIVGLLSKDFLKLVLIGFVIAVPIAFYVMNQWLQNFAYRINIGVGIFLLAGGLALLIALATVSWQSIRAALANPVDSLRSE